MERYVDTMHGTGATVAQSTEVARHAIQAVNLDQDSRSMLSRENRFAPIFDADDAVSLWRSKISSTIGSVRIEPVPYHNFYVSHLSKLAAADL